MVPPDLERRILELSSGINLRPTLEASARLGELLLEAESHVGHGEWVPWLKRLGIRPRTAQTHMQVAKTPAPAFLGAGVTIERFLEFVRDAKRKDRLAERARLREEVASRRGALPKGSGWRIETAGNFSGQPR